MHSGPARRHGPVALRSTVLGGLKVSTLDAIAEELPSDDTRL